MGQGLLATVEAAVFAIEAKQSIMNVLTEMAASLLVNTYGVQQQAQFDLSWELEYF